MIRRPPNAHPEAALLHAFAAGDLDPTLSAAVDAHVSTCSHCARALARVAAVRGLFRDHAATAVDEVSWQRLERRVKRDLRADSRRARTARPERWRFAAMAAGALASAGCLLLVVWIARDGAPAAPSADRAPQVLASGDAVLEATLASRATTRLAPGSYLVAPVPVGAHVELSLEYGRIDVALPMDFTPTDARSLTVRTPGFVVYAYSRDFSVAYSADAYGASVRDGEVVVVGEAFGGRSVIRKGEAAHADEAPPAERAVAARTREPKREAVRPGRAEESASVEPPAAREPTILRTSSEGDTQVSLVREARDAVASTWREANDAYYKTRDLERAVRLAREVVAMDPQRLEASSARELLCDAHIALRRTKEAIEACSALLDVDATPESQRPLHYLLGTVYRTLAGDCVHAIEHYNQAIVFGGTSVQDDEVRLYRATCALEIGDVAQARRDIRSLEPRASNLGRPDELRQLEEKFRSATGGEVTRFDAGSADPRQRMKGSD